MNLLEILIERTVNRLKRIDENPDPKRLRSDRMGYELDLDLYTAQLEAWQQGKPILGHIIRWSFQRALGFQPITYAQIVPHFVSEASRYRQIIRNTGFPEYSCNFLTYSAAAVLAGDLPAPSFVLLQGGECFVEPYIMKMLAEHFGVPYFQRDCPVEYSEENIKYMADQLGEFIEFAESKVPGIRYNQDRHIELLEAERIGLGYRLKEWNLRKHVPCPLSNRDMFGFSDARSPQRAAYPAKALEYWRLRTEEIEERVDKGVGREERLRVLWVFTIPLHVNPVTLLASRGVVALPMAPGNTGFLSGRCGSLGDEKEFGRKLSLFEEDARMLLARNWRPQASTWVSDIIMACQQLGCDAIIYYQLTGCVPTSSPAKLVADKAQRELGVPTLIIPGAPMDPSSLPAVEFESRLMEFIDMVLAQKGRN